MRKHLFLGKGHCVCLKHIQHFLHSHNHALHMGYGVHSTGHNHISRHSKPTKKFTPLKFKF